MQRACGREQRVHGTFAEGHAVGDDAAPAAVAAERQRLAYETPHSFHGTDAAHARIDQMTGSGRQTLDAVI